MKTPLHTLINQYIRDNKGSWISKWDIERFGQMHLVEAYTACRRTQEMTQAGHRNFDPEIERGTDEKGHVRYRVRPDNRLVFGLTRPETKLFNLEFK